MKQCPQCQSEYEDSINFCAKDGRSLVARVAVRTRLCPHCANGIPENAPQCPYCKTDLTASSAPQWPTREKELPETKTPSQTNKIPAKSQAILVAGIVVFAVGVFLIGGQKERMESQPLISETIKDLQVSEQKIHALEGQLAQVRQELNDGSQQLAELKTKFENSQKELSITQQRLSAATREVDRLASSRAPTGARTSPRPIEPPPPAPAPARRVAELGLYETTRATSIYEEPSGSSRVVSQVARGTRITVVKSVGDWLEVRSKHGNPPGFVRRDDAMFVGRAN